MNGVDLLTFLPGSFTAKRHVRHGYGLKVVKAPPGSVVTVRFDENNPLTPVTTLQINSTVRREFDEFYLTLTGFTAGSVVIAVLNDPDAEYELKGALVQPEIVFLTAAAPTLGSDHAYALPLGYRYRIKTLTAKLVCSANVANRVSAITLKENSGADPFYVAYHGTPITAGLTVRYQGSEGFVVPAYSPAEKQWGWPLPNDLILDGGAIIGTLTTALDSLDQWSAMIIYAERWQ